jgi:ABC-type bacteriocin/lantibiotic exporter with double-glycine peptidase domain
MRFALLLFLRSNRRHLVELLLATGFLNLAALAVPLFSMLVYDRAVGNPLHDTLWALAVGCTLVLLLEAVLRGARLLMVERAGAHWDAFLDQRLIQGVLHAPAHRTLPAGEVVARTRELAATRDALSAASLLGLADLPFAVLFAVALWAIAGPLVVLPLGLGTLLLATCWLTQHRADLYQRRSHGALREKIGVLVDVLVQRDHIGGPHRRAQALQRFQAPALQGARQASRARIWHQWPAQLAPLVLGVGTVAVMVGGVYRIEQQLLTVGGLISASMLTTRLLSVLLTLAPLTSRWREFRQALDGLARAVDLEQRATLPQAHDPAALATEGIRLDQLGLRFPDAPQPTLQGLTVHLRPGEVVAVVGACGGGKSTLLRLLAAQALPSEGRLSVGGRVIDDDDARRWLSSVVHLKPQEPGFWEGSVRDIVANGDPAVTDEAVTQALRQAGLGPLMDQGALGLNTPVRSQGIGLSGGQKQSLALARALASEAPILLLDEPTLGLDRNAQERVLQALRECVGATGQPRIVLVATHAAEVIRCADRVLVLDRGRLAADGTPDRLLSAASHAPSRRAPAAAAQEIA